MITVTAYAARKGVSKAGKAYFQQVLEVPQAGRPAAQFQRFSNDEAHVLAAGTYTADLGLYPKTFTLASVNGEPSKRETVLVASLFNFVLVK